MNQARDRAYAAGIVYVGPIQLGLTKNKSIVGVARRVRDALALQAENDDVGFDINFEEDIVDRPETKSFELKKVARIIRQEGDARPYVDLYEYSWSGAVAANWESQPLAVRLAKAIVASLHFGRYRRFLKSSGTKNPKGRIQVWVAGLAMAAMLLSTIAVGVAAVEVAWTTITDLADSGDLEDTSTTSSTVHVTTTSTDTETANTVDDEEPEESSFVSSLLRVWAIAAIVLAALFRKPLKRAISAGAVLLAAESYLRLGDRRSAAVGELNQQIDSLLTTTSYERIDVVTFSFGAVVVLDAYFPSSQSPSRALREHTKTLTTVGVPLDFVRAVNPTYFGTRNWSPATPEQWRNIYSPVDMLGSNFRTDEDGESVFVVAAAADRDEAVVTPTTNVLYDTGVEVTLLNALILTGFSAHDTYWGDDDESDQNALTEVVAEFYAGTVLLA